MASEERECAGAYCCHIDDAGAPCKEPPSRRLWLQDRGGDFRSTDACAAHREDLVGDDERVVGIEFLDAPAGREP